jgi:hypothetical protein
MISGSAAAETANTPDSATANKILRMIIVFLLERTGACARNSASHAAQNEIIEQGENAEMEEALDQAPKAAHEDAYIRN